MINNNFCSAEMLSSHLRISARLEGCTFNPRLSCRTMQEHPVVRGLHGNRIRIFLLNRIKPSETKSKLSLKPDPTTQCRIRPYTKPVTPNPFPALQDFVAELQNNRI